MYYFIVDNYINGDPKEYATYIDQVNGCKIYASQGERAWIENIDQQYQERPIPNFWASFTACALNSVS